MARTHTHTFSELEVPAELYDLVYAKLKEAGWDQALPLEPRGPIDMQGIGLTRGSDLPVLRKEVVKLEPGDTLVVRSSEMLSLSAINRLRLEFERVFVGHKCVMLEAGIEMSVMREVPRNIDPLEV